MIRVENASVVFNKGTSIETTALDNVSLLMNENDFTVVIGANGSGKSTLLNLIAGTVAPGKGKIYINGDDISGLEEYKRARYISRIFQNPLQGTSPELTVLENFRLASLRTKSKTLSIGSNCLFKKAVVEKISFLRMGLEKAVDRPMGSLSGGQRQALTLVMGIMDQCNIMLLDEPTAALDPKSSMLVMQKANEIISTNKLTALLVTHHLKDAIQFGNRLIVMQEGKILMDASHDVKKALTVEKLAEFFN